MNVEYSQTINVVRAHEGCRAGQKSGNELIYLYIGRVIGWNRCHFYCLFGMSQVSQLIFFCFLQPVVGPHPTPSTFFPVQYLLSYTVPEQLSKYKLGHGLDGQGAVVRFLPGVTDIFFPKQSRPALGPAEATIQCVTRTSSGTRRPGLEADYSPASSAEATSACSLTSTPGCAFVAWCVIKHGQRKQHVFMQPIEVTQCR